MPGDVAAVPRPFAVEPGGVRLAVRLTPRAGRDRVEGVVRGADGRPALHLRLAAPPVEGAANRALIAWLAAALALRKSDIAIRSGETARLKILHLEGDADRLFARLAALCDTAAERTTQV
jgi:uncharacterized protein YggU (UPF0235/DUF167 family)